MLIFFNFGGNGGGRWYIGPLITLLPILLSSGILGLPLHLLSLLFGFGGSRNVYVYDPLTHTWRRQGAAAAGRGAAAGGSDGSASGGGADVGGEGSDIVSSVLVALTSMLVTAALTVLLMKFALSARQHGVGATLRRVLFEGFQGGGGDNGGGGGGQQRRQGEGWRRQRTERVVRQVQALPVEVYHSREELERLPVAELKQMLKARGSAGAPPGGCLEKRELVDAISQGGNSTADSCSICCEDYASGDVLRALRCGHRFHLECIDRWFLSSSADYSRPPACPMCNAELDMGSDDVAGSNGEVAGGGGSGAAGGDGLHDSPPRQRRAQPDQQQQQHRQQ